MKTLILITMLALSSISYAGPGHDHSHGHSHEQISKSKTIQVGKKHIARLVKSGKIDASWKAAKHIKSEKKKFGNKVEWVVSYKNEKGVKGKTIYIFLKLSGKYVAANFTGK